jgi:signal transduction histidine kinase
MLPAKGRMPALLSNRYLTRLRAPAGAGEEQQVESVLASARVFLASSALVAIFLDPTEPSRYTTLAYGLLIGYVLYSVLILLLLRWRPVAAIPWIVSVDILLPAIFTLFTEGPNSPFFLFFVFVLMAAAFRWGFPETIATAALVTVVMMLEAMLLSYGPREWGMHLEGEYQINRFVIRSTYLLILGLLVGYLAEEEKQTRAETAVITRILGHARLENGVRGTLQAIVQEILDIFVAARALLMVEEDGTGRIFLWHSERRPGRQNTIRLAEVASEQRPQYLVPIPVHSFYARRGERGWQVWALDPQGLRSRPPEGWSPADTPELGDSRTLLSIAFTLGEEWSGRFLVFDCSVGPEKFKEVRFLQRLLRQAGPALYTVYLLRRLRSRAGAIERARVARELHDGAIQALIAVEMQVDVLRRQAGQDTGGALAGSLTRIQELLRDQVFNLRTLMQEMKPLELKPGELLEYLADMIERFRRDTGIAARFVSDLQEVTLPPRVSRELARIVQEALVNVRKHSGAQHVLVRFGSQAGRWQISIEDDGRGFQFQGRLSLDNLEAARQGPQIIKERVRSLGGELSIESSPGRGSHLDISIPQKAQVSYA